MDSRIVGFAEVLRQNGVRVSTSEVVDASRATAEVGLADAHVFRSALRATLVKRESDVETFERAFTFYFSAAAETFANLDRSLLRRIEEEGLLEGDELTMVLATVNRLFNQMSPLAQAMLQGDAARLARILRGATLQLDLSRMESAMQAGFFARRMMAGAGGEAAATDLRALEAELGARGLSAQGMEIISRELGDAMRKVEALARKEVEREGKARVRRAAGGLAERPFHTLSRQEVEKTEAAVRRLAERLKSRLVRKQRSRRRGTLNLHRTLRRNLPWGGIPMVPQFRSRRPERPDVIVLCDVSDSVRNASRMMLLFMHTLQSLFTRVRSFVFVSDIGEVTEHFRAADVDEAVDLATTGRTISLHSNSNYGNAFASFARRWLGTVSSRTTVMVIGDGRNNYNPNNLWALREIRQKAKRLLWVCTEDRRSWGFGDSEMPAFAKVCHRVVVVQTLADLENLAEQLVPE